MGEWRDCTLGAVAIIVMGQSPAGETCNNNGVGFPLLNGPTEFGSHHPIANQFTVDPKKLSDPGDLLFCVRGSTTGRMNWADRVYAIGRGIAAIRHKRDSKLQPFVRAVVEFSLPQLLQSATGSTFPNVSAGQLANVAFPILSSVQEEFAASILGALDDKIELNRQMNETLESMARLFFKDWFVDFGPTRAKAEGLPPYLEPELWSLFPDVLDDDDKPMGWRIKPLDQIANFLNGLALQKFPPNGLDFLRVIKIAELRSGITAKSDFASIVIPPQYVIEDGDILFSWSGSLTHQMWTGGRGALNQHLFKVTSSQYPKWFFFYWISEHMTNFQAIAASKATTMGHIQRHHLTEAETVIPSDLVLAAANDLISPLFSKILTNNLENRTLTKTRDLLLPKLMSGEIRLQEAEKIVEEIV